MLGENFYHSTENFDETSQISKNAIKNTLKEYEAKPIQIGQNYIEIVKISDRCVIINESRNGLLQQERKVNLEKAIDYINYKKSLMIRDLEFNNLNFEVDENDQNVSREYKTQLENYSEVLIDLSNIVHNIWKVNGGLVTNINVNENENQVEIYIDNKRIDIKRNQLNNELTLNLNYATTKIHNERDYLIQNCTVEIAKLIFSDSDVALFFRQLIGQAIMMKSQLKILALVYRSTDNVSIDPKLATEIDEFVRGGKKSDMLEFSYGKHRNGKRLYERVFEVVKETKIRTVVNVYAYQLDENSQRMNESKILEYNNQIVKMNKEPKKKINIIASHYVWNK